MIELNLINHNKAKENLAWSIVEEMSPLETIFMVSIMNGIDEDSKNGEKSHRIKISDLLQWSGVEDKYDESDNKLSVIRNLKIIEAIETLGYKTVVSVYLDEVAIIWGL